MQSGKVLHLWGLFTKSILGPHLFSLLFQAQGKWTFSWCVPIMVYCAMESPKNKASHRLQKLQVKIKPFLFIKLVVSVIFYSNGKHVNPFGNCKIMVVDSVLCYIIIYLFVVVFFLFSTGWSEFGRQGWHQTSRDHLPLSLPSDLAEVSYWVESTEIQGQ